MDHILAGGSDYFDTYEFSEEWRREDQVVQMRFWHRPLREMIGSLVAADFKIDVIDEPDPEEIVRNLDPAAWEKLKREPRFIFFLASRN